MSDVKKVGSSFGPLIDKPKHTQTDYTKDDDIVGYCEQEYVVKTGEGDTDFVKKTRVVEFERKNRQDYIDSFAEDVGILNVLKKVAVSGDESLVKQRPDPAFMDLTDFPTNKEDMFNKVKEGVDAFDKLPDDIKKKMSMEQFVNTFGQEQFDALIKEKVDAVLAAQKVQKEKEGE